MGKFLRFITSRLFITIVLFLVEILFALRIFYWMAFVKNFYFLFYLVSLAVTLIVMTRKEEPAYKLVWLLIITVFPTLGGVLYLFVGNKKIGHMAKKKLEKYRSAHGFSKSDYRDEAVDMIKDDGMKRLSRYIYNLTENPAYLNSKGTYFQSGDEFYSDLAKELERAEKFIFIEYFIIGEGMLWSKILPALVEKAKAGVDVRVIYDDVGSINTLPYKYYKSLGKMGIKAVAFNPVKWQFNPRLNFRDHRKIFSIDGKVCYTGGLNLADEYMNDEIRFGFWKDNAIKLEGDVVFSLTSMFLEIWDAITETEEDKELFRAVSNVESDGVIQAFGSSPFFSESIGEKAYLQVVNNAKRYVYITTPYLIPDDAMIDALKSAAESGVDVRIVTPRYPDKKQVFEVTRANYDELIKSGVRIFEYLPGFVHTKMFIADDDVAVVGTTNLDYRSFFLHFELSVVFFSSSIIKDVKEDMMKILDYSEEVDGRIKVRNPIKKCTRFFYSLFSPVL